MDYQKVKRHFQSLEDSHRAGQCGPQKDEHQAIDSNGTTTKLPARHSSVSGWIIAAVVLLLVFVAGASAGCSFSPSNQAKGGPTQSMAPTPYQPTATEVEKTTFQSLDATTVKADGNPVSDAHGVALTAPVGSLDDGVTAQMTALKVQGELYQSITDSYSLDTDFYSFVAQGQNDTVGRSTLSFPASSPQSRVVELIDQKYMAILNVKPENGKLTIQARMGPTPPNDQTDEDLMGSPGSIYYAVITPKTGAASMAPAGVQEVSWLLPQTTPALECSLELKERFYSEACRTNAADTVIVLFPYDIGLTTAQGDSVVQEIEARAKTYYDQGFKGAMLNSNDPLEVIVTPGSGDAHYSVYNGVIYLPVDMAKDMPGKGRTLWHEMGHYVEDVAYNMTLAFLIQDKRWWQETAADNMAFLTSKDAVVDNMNNYGMSTATDNNLIFTISPYQWPSQKSEYYIFSQLVKLNLCDSGCPLTLAGFKAAINNGTYPYEQSAAQEQLTANLDDYARYLLGTAPLKANTNIPLDAVKSQEKYGQTVNIKQSTKSDFDFLSNGIAPQVVTAKNKYGPDSLVIQAPLQKDGVYPLLITSGSGGKYSGLPAMLTIDAGTPVYYRVDGGDVQYDDGSQALQLGPIHVNAGISELRLVALSKTGGQTFKARLDIISLDGAWIIQHGDMVNDGISCTTTGTLIGTVNIDNIKQFLPLASDAILSSGDMGADVYSPSLDWTAFPGRLPEGIKPDMFTFKATALITPDGVELQSDFDLPKPQQTSQTLPPGAGEPDLAIIAFLPTVALSRHLRNKRRRALALGLLVVLGGLLLVGCIGFAAYGHSTADVKITGLQYVDGEGLANWTLGQSPTGEPIWAFTKGTATYQVNVTTEVASTDDQGNNISEKITCTGPITYNITGEIYRMVEITIPNSP